MRLLAFVFNVPRIMILASVRTQRHRTRPTTVGERPEFQDIVMDAASHKVWRQDNEIKPGPTEFRLLSNFMENPGRVWRRE